MINKAYFIHTIYDDFYGLVNYRLIGMISDKDIKSHCMHETWKKERDPFMLFKNVISKKVIKNNNQIEYYFVALRNDNLNWRPEFNNNYYNFWKQAKDKSLPFAECVQKVKKWQSDGTGLFTPRYLKDIHSIEDLYNI